MPATAPRLLLLTACLAAFASPAWSQSPPTTAEIVGQLKGLEAPAEIDIPSLRQQAADRVKSKVEAVSLKRRPVAAELLRLPHVDFDVQFNPDTPVIRPESYAMIGRLADALYDPALLSSGFLIVGRTESVGRRDANLTLSQRRAEAIRDALVTTFKVSPKRLQAVGLGEEQLVDADHPKNSINQQAGIVTVR